MSGAAPTQTSLPKSVPLASHSWLSHPLSPSWLGTTHCQNEALGRFSGFNYVSRAWGNELRPEQSLLLLLEQACESPGFSFFPAGSGDSSSSESKRLGNKLQHGVTAALADLKTLAKHPVYVLNVAGTAVYTGTHSARNAYSTACSVCTAYSVCLQFVACMSIDQDGVSNDHSMVPEMPGCEGSKRDCRVFKMLIIKGCSLHDRPLYHTVCTN